MGSCGKILDLKSWDPVSYKVGEDAVLSFELKRLNQAEAKPIARLLIGIWGAASAALAEGDEGDPKATSQKQTEALLRMAETIPDDVAQRVFAEFVRGPKGGPIEGVLLDGEPILTGADFYKIADRDLVQFVVSELAGRATLSGSEGKGSSSPSTSSAGEGQPSPLPASAAKSTGSEDSTALSTATERPTSHELCSQPVEA